MCCALIRRRKIETDANHTARKVVEFSADRGWEETRRGYPAAKDRSFYNANFYISSYVRDI